VLEVLKTAICRWCLFEFLVDPI